MRIERDGGIDRRHRGLGTAVVDVKGRGRAADGARERRERHAGAADLGRVRPAFRVVRQVRVGVRRRADLPDEERDRQQADDEPETTSGEHLGLR